MNSIGYATGLHTNRATLELAGTPAKAGRHKRKLESLMEEESNAYIYLYAFKARSPMRCTPSHLKCAIGNRTSSLDVKTIRRNADKSQAKPTRQVTTGEPKFTITSHPRGEEGLQTADRDKTGRRLGSRAVYIYAVHGCATHAKAVQESEVRDCTKIATLSGQTRPATTAKPRVHVALSERTRTRRESFFTVLSTVNDDCGVVSSCTASPLNFAPRSSPEERKSRNLTPRLYTCQNHDTTTRQRKTPGSSWQPGGSFKAEDLDASSNAKVTGVPRRRRQNEGRKKKNNAITSPCDVTTSEITQIRDVTMTTHGDVITGHRLVKGGPGRSRR